MRSCTTSDPESNNAYLLLRMYLLHVIEFMKLNNEGCRLGRYASIYYAVHTYYVTTDIFRINDER